MKYIEFETAQELGDYLNGLYGKNAEFEWENPFNKGKWISALTDEARAVHSLLLNHPDLTKVRAVVYPTV